MLPWGMRVFMTGANGFIGSALTAALIAAGHEVVAAVRRPAAFERRFPGSRAVAADLNDLTRAEDWAPLLADCAAVVNCAGILQSRRGQSIEAIHEAAPIALFQAAGAAGITKVVQISAVSIDADTAYARSKKAADEALMALDLDWVVLRPSLVYSAAGAYGGTALLRAQAVTPFAIPVIGAGDQAFQPIALEDLAQVVVKAVESAALNRKILEPCGPERLTMAAVLGRLRAWLGLPPAPLLPVPLALVRLACSLGDLFGSGPITTTSLKQLEHGNAADYQAYRVAGGLEARPLAAALAARPAQSQDLWHARLTLLRPLVRAVLILMWLVSGLYGLLLPTAVLIAPIATLGLSDMVALGLARGFGLFDLALAALLLFRVRPRLVGIAQLVLVAGYTLMLSVTAPGLWLEPLGPLLKNLPILALIACWMVLEEER